MSEIVTSKLDDIADVIDSLHKTPKYSDSGYPMVRCVDLSYGSLKLENTRSVSEEVFNEYSRRYNPNNSDIIITRVGANFGVTSFVEETEFCLGQNTAAIVPANINARYLYYILNSVVGRQQMNMSVAGAAQPTLSLKAIKNLDIPRLGDDTEEKIANIIGNLDDKIELNRQTNQTLEQIAQTIFKSWFVDFEPVKAKIEAKQNGQDPELAAMCAISGKTEEQLKAFGKEVLQQLKTTAALFPDALVESELGEIPEGWCVKNFSKLVRLDTTSVKPNNEPEKLWEHYSIPAYDVDESPAYHLGLEIKSNKYKVDESSILVSKLNPHFPRTWWPDIEDSDAAICSTEFMQFIPLNTNYRVFVLGMVLSRPFQDGIMRRVTGSTGSRQRAQPPQVANMDVVMPKEDLIDGYSNYLTSFLVTKAKNVKENLTLAKMRKTLLPKLLSGEITIGNTESTVEAVA